MKFLEKLDLWILDQIFQKIADYVYDRWGKSCFWLAIMSCWLILIFWGIETGMRRSIALSILFVIFSLMQIFGNMPRWQQLEKNPMALSARRVLNPERIFWPLGLARIFLVLIIVLSKRGEIVALYKGDLAILPNWATDLFFLSTIYFSACTPKPPKPLKAGNELANAISVRS